MFPPVIQNPAAAAMAAPHDLLAKARSIAAAMKKLVGDLGNDAPISLVSAVDDLKDKLPAAGAGAGPAGGKRAGAAALFQACLDIRDALAALKLIGGMTAMAGQHLDELVGQLEQAIPGLDAMGLLGDAQAAPHQAAAMHAPHQAAAMPGPRFASPRAAVVNGILDELGQAVSGVSSAKVKSRMNDLRNAASVADFRDSRDVDQFRRTYDSFVDGLRGIALTGEQFTDVADCRTRLERQFPEWSASCCVVS